LHMKWPLTSQSHGSVSQRESLFFSLRIKLHANVMPFFLAFEASKLFNGRPNLDMTIKLQVFFYIGTAVMSHVVFVLPQPD
jgi:hypothetical protein